jgi:hypothetical protein
VLLLVSPAAGVLPQELLRVDFVDPDVTVNLLTVKNEPRVIGVPGTTMKLSPACLGSKDSVPVDQREPALPHDALRSVFSYLDW